MRSRSTGRESNSARTALAGTTSTRASCSTIRGGAGPSLEQRHLAEQVALAEAADAAAAAGNGNGAAQDHEQRPAGRSLPHEHLAGRRVLLGAGLAQRLPVLLCRDLFGHGRIVSGMGLARVRLRLR